MLAKAFPDDPLVGEEDTTELRISSNASLKDRVVELANEALTSELVMGDNEQWGIGSGQERSAGELLDAIDRGTFDGGRNGSAYMP